MTDEEYFIKNYPDFCYGDRPLSPHFDFFQDGVEFGERESEKRIEELEKEVEILKKRVDYLYNEIRPIIRRENCHLKHYVLDDDGKAVACYSKYPCTSCEYYKESK